MKQLFHNRTLRRVCAILLVCALVLPLALYNKPSKAASSNGINVTEQGGWLETAFVEWEPLSGATGYNVYYKKSSASSYTQIDDQLIRKYNGYYRADALGLSAGNYTLKIVPIINGSVNESKAVVTSTLSVKAHERTGFAFVNGSSSGAYNNDGTLKSNAVVVYITPDTKNSASAVGATGFQNIVTALKKNSSNPVCIRMIGNITDPSSLQGGDILIDGVTGGLTIEGVGFDAVANGWGIRIKNSSNVEIRNIGLMNCDSSEGDNVGLQQSNDHVWVHNCDFFYGEAGSDADQAKGDGALDTKKSKYVTHSYNHFWDTGKSHLNGNKESADVLNFITYHHNWYDHSDSRHPLVRCSTAVHCYNNLYDGIAKYGMICRLGASIFSEANYFLDSNDPMLISQQGTDIADGDAIASDAGGMIKSYGNVYAGSTVKPITHKDNSTSFDCYEASSRSEKVPSSYKTKSGGNTYSNFDTASGFYSYTVQSATDAKATVEKYAGRVQGGDFDYTFSGTALDRDYSVNSDLKNKLKNYKSSIVSIGGNGKKASTSTSGSVATTAATQAPTQATQAPATQAPTTQSSGGSSAVTGTIANGWYYIKNVNSNKYLQVENNNGYAGANVCQGTGTGVAGQKWYVELASDGYYTLKSALGNYNLDVYNWGATDGTNIGLWDANGYDCQKFEIRQISNGQYAVLTKLTNSEKGLDVYNISTEDGANICQWSYWGGGGQLWIFETTSYGGSGSSTPTQSTTQATQAPTQNSGSSSSSTSTSWNFKNSNFKSLGTISSSTTVDGLGLIATSSKTMQVKAETVKVDGTEYTYALALGGGGSTSYRAIKVPVSGNDVIKVVLKSSGSSTRTLVVADASGKKLGEISAPSTATLGSYTYSGNAGYVYLYSSGSGINVFKVQVDSKSATGGSGSSSGSTTPTQSTTQATQAPTQATTQATQAPTQSTTQQQISSNAIYVSPSGSSSASGTYSSPMAFTTAITKVSAGQTIYMLPGTYKFSSTILIQESNKGNSGAYKKVVAYNNGEVILDFSSMSESGSNRGIVLDGSYWHFYGIDIKGAGDNGMLLSGDNNIIEMCQFYENHDSGLQLSRYNTSYSSISQWPSNNLIKNCTSFNNKDEATAENADGFAAKLTCGSGNVFDGCIAYCNSDDGWDLYAKPETGSIGVVTIKNCVAFGNGKLTNGSGSANGDMNGFKLGGSNGQCPTPHVITNSLAFNNGACGFTDNGNGGAIKMTNCTAVGNGVYASKGNFMCYRTSSSATYSNLLSYNNSASDKYLGKLSKVVSANGGKYYYTASGSYSSSTSPKTTAVSISSSDFVSTSIPGYSSGKYATNYHEVFRNSDGSINMNGLFEIKSSSSLKSYGVGSSLSSGTSGSTNPGGSSSSGSSSSGSSSSGSSSSGSSSSGSSSSGSSSSGSSSSTTATVHNFTASGKTSSFFTITGNLSTSKGTVSYGGMTLKQCLKMESSTSIKFTTTKSMKLTLVFNSDFSKKVKIDGTSYKASNGVVTVTLSAGTHTITKGDTTNLYYISLQ